MEAYNSFENSKKNYCFCNAMVFKIIKFVQSKQFMTLQNPSTFTKLWYCYKTPKVLCIQTRHISIHGECCKLDLELTQSFTKDRLYRKTNGYETGFRNTSERNKKKKNENN